MQSEMPFYENVEQALAACVQGLGGAKAVGGILWPHKEVEDARTLLLNCINPIRKEKLELGQVMYLFREAKNIGLYSPFLWFANQIGYDARPITHAEEVDRLASVVEQSSKTLANAVAALERMQRAGIKVAA